MQTTEPGGCSLTSLFGQISLDIESDQMLASSGVPENVLEHENPRIPAGLRCAVPSTEQSALLPAWLFVLYTLSVLMPQEMKRLSWLTGNSD